MSTPLDRYTSAYLRSGYSFNDYRLKFVPSYDSQNGLDSLKVVHGYASNLGLGFDLAKSSMGGGDKALNDMTSDEASLCVVTADNANQRLAIGEASRSGGVGVLTTNMRDLIMGTLM
ncbi:hypothetical protein TorRG33x02_174530, partial [Trema orientale]